jgi:hypothetical protein
MIKNSRIYVTMPHLICFPMTSAINREKERPLIEGRSKSGYRCMKIVNLRFKSLINFEKSKIK